MNIFNASHALAEIEARAKEHGLPENQVVLFYMWLSDDRFNGHTFDDGFIKNLLSDMDSLIKEFDEWAHKEAMETLERPEPW